MTPCPPTRRLSITMVTLMHVTVAAKSNWNSHKGTRMQAVTPRSQVSSAIPGDNEELRSSAPDSCLLSHPLLPEQVVGGHTPPPRIECASQWVFAQPSVCINRKRALRSARDGSIHGLAPAVCVMLCCHLLFILSSAGQSGSIRDRRKGPK